MNNNAPARLTPAAYLLIATVVVGLITVGGYLANQPFVYLPGLPLTLVGALLTGDTASRYRVRS